MIIIKAIISTYLHCALLETASGKYFLLETEERPRKTTKELIDYWNMGQSIYGNGKFIEISKENISIQWIKDALVLAIQRKRAINMALIGMDRLVGKEVSRCNIEELNALLFEKKVRKHLEKKIKELSACQMKNFDVDSAIKLSDKHRFMLAGNLYRKILWKK